MIPSASESFEYPPNNWWRHPRQWFLVIAWLAMGLHNAPAQVLITNASVVNVTPASFSVVWAVSSPITPAITPAIAIYSDSSGRTNLSGQVGIEFYPLDTGDPTLTNSYARRLSQALLRLQTMSNGLVHVRVSGCSPNTPYYYRLQVSNPNGPPTVWPPSGALPSITTPGENALALQSKQILINLAGDNQNGSIFTLSNTNNSGLLGAVISDGAGTNQVLFSISDLVAGPGATNYLPPGTQLFTAAQLGFLSNNFVQTYALVFSTGFSVSQLNEFALGSYLAITFGSAVLQAGASGGIPIGIVTSDSLTSLAFVLNLPANRLSDVSLQALSPQVGSTTLRTIGANLSLIALGAANGQAIQGTQQIAQVNFGTVSNQSSAFLTIAAQAPRGANSDGSQAAISLVQPGRLAIIAAQQPLLDASFAPDGTRSLSLYALPGASYQLDYSTNLIASNAWTSLMSVQMTNLVRVLTGVNTNLPRIFYRAHPP